MALQGQFKMKTVRGLKAHELEGQPGAEMKQTEAMV